MNRCFKTDILYTGAISVIWDTLIRFIYSIQEKNYRHSTLLLYIFYTLNGKWRWIPSQTIYDFLITLLKHLFYNIIVVIIIFKLNND